MTIPGLLDVSDDKEKLVIKTDVATIMPKRDKLIKIKQRRCILRLFTSLALVLVLLLIIFLTFCYVKQIGPFERIFRAKYVVGNDNYNHKKIYESLEITDNYALINMPRIHISLGRFQPVKTLHVFKKKLTVIKHNGVCFVRPMLSGEESQRNWYERMERSNSEEPPRQFIHMHWRFSSNGFSDDYLREHVHEMAAAMCASRPVIHLRIFMLNPDLDRKRLINMKRMLLSSQRRINEENKPKAPVDMQVVQENTNTPNEFNKNIVTRLSNIAVASTMSPNFQDLIQQKPLLLRSGQNNRRKRSVTMKDCQIVAKVMEGYYPINGDKMQVDYIHDC